MNINDIIVTESQQLDEIDWKAIQRKAGQFTRGAQKFTKNVADTGAAVGGAASALGGAAKEVGKQLIAKPVAATYGAAKSGLGKAADLAKGVYGDVKKGLQTGAKGISTATTDIGKAGQWAGQELGKAGAGIQAVGRGVGKAVGGTVGAAGALAGGATTGVGRAAVKGFQAGAQTVGGAPAQRGQGVYATPPDAVGAATPASTTSAPATTATTPATAAPRSKPVPVSSAKQSVDSALTAIKKVRSRDRAAVMKYAQDKLLGVGQPSAAPQWRGRQTAKVAAPAVAEALTWSKSFDPGMIVWKRMHEAK